MKLDGTRRVAGFRRALRRGAPLFIVAIVVLALGSGCCAGAMGSGMGGMHGVGSRAAQTPVVSNAPDVTVEIRDFDFSPRDLTVNAGTAITWVNRDSVPHDATDENGDWGTGLFSGGESETLTFESPGEYGYYCTIHPNMRATLKVE